MKYNTSSPFFPKQDIKNIISQLENIFEGKGFFAKGPRVKEFEKLFSGYIGSNYGVAGSGELDNGWTFALSTTLADGMTLSSSTTALTMGSLGTITMNGLLSIVSSSLSFKYPMIPILVIELIVIFNLVSLTGE